MHLREDPRVELAVLDTQIRPQDAREALRRLEVDVSRVVLVDCDHPQRHVRLRDSRGQPDLASPAMDCWAAYMRGQADALELPIINTTSAPVAESLAVLEEMVTDVLRQARAADSAGDEAALLIHEGERCRARGPTGRRPSPLHPGGGLLPAGGTAEGTGARHQGPGAGREQPGAGRRRKSPVSGGYEICRSEDDPRLLAHTVRQLGDLHHHSGRLDLAETCYREAVELYRCEKLTPPVHLANALRALALLQEQQGNVAEARNLWEEARELYLMVKVQERVAESAEHLARLAGLAHP